jgi:hypothetical protein
MEKCGAAPGRVGSRLWVICSNSQTPFVWEEEDGDAGTVVFPALQLSKLWERERGKRGHELQMPNLGFAQAVRREDIS